MDLKQYIGGLSGYFQLLAREPAPTVIITSLPEAGTQDGSSTSKISLSTHTHTLEVKRMKKKKKKEKRRNCFKDFPSPHLRTSILCLTHTHELKFSLFSAGCFLSRNVSFQLSFDFL